MRSDKITVAARRRWLEFEVWSLEHGHLAAAFLVLSCAKDYLKKVNAPEGPPTYEIRVSGHAARDPAFANFPRSVKRKGGTMRRPPLPRPSLHGRELPPLLDGNARPGKKVPHA